MKKILFTFFLSVAAAGVMAQDQASADTTYWEKKGVAGINLSQTSLSNWSAGGDGSIAFDLYRNYSLDYKKDKQLWTNRLELAYGLNNTSSQGTRKTNDKIYFASNYGYKISEHWYASALLNFTTQFDKGYKYASSVTEEDVVISRFMAPGYLSFGLGFTWTPKSWLTVNLSPATWRGTFVLDDALSDAGAFGVDPGKKILNEFGGNIVAEAKLNSTENMAFHSRLSLFSNYLKKPQNIVGNWDNQNLSLIQI